MDVDPVDIAVGLLPLGGKGKAKWMSLRCTCPGDVCKAFGAGADFVMLGRVWELWQGFGRWHAGGA